MKANEIRSKFFKFFEKNGHKVISSSSLIPHNDPSLLFANAGMNQFKDYFTGKERPAFKRAVTSQKCVRAGGKHNDLENVGFTARHHTFFEMLGNFSFGDYFKDDAIKYAWEFLTQELKIPPEKLFISVHEKDDEALEIWHKKIGIDKAKIFKRGDKDNFWEMGEFGPCGPCSEIFYDFGEKFKDKNLKNPKILLDDELRYVEIWNLVFMQFEKKPEGIFPLPKPSIDTGAGLERITAAIQDCYYNYDTDLFTDIKVGIEKITNKKYSEDKNKTIFRILADHIRSTTMLITDGVLPSNEGRGYVLRRIIRRAIRYLNEIYPNTKEASFYKLVPYVFKTLGESYPENKNNQKLAEDLLKLEEEKFQETLTNGLKFLNQELLNYSGKKNSEFSGVSAFKLYDTFGFPLDLTESILKEKNLTLNVTEFNECMKKQKEASRLSWKGSQSDERERYYFELKERFGATSFCGYEKVECEAKLLHCENVSDDIFECIFDKTPFYGESGGQIGDSGSINDIKINDTQIKVPGLYVHLIKGNPKFKIGNNYHLKVDTQRRERIKAHHSATHLLQSALITILGKHIKQAGSYVSDERLRFDFTHPKALTQNEIDAVESLVNQKILAGLNVKAEVKSKNQALQDGAMAIFGEKYGDEVRVLKMGDFSLELCGGTHVVNTKDIATFLIVSEASLASGVRRIEALAYESATTYLKEQKKELSKISKLIGCSSLEVFNRVDQYINENKLLKKDFVRLNEKLSSLENKSLIQNLEKIKNIDTLISNVPEGADLKTLSDQFFNQNPKGLLILYGQNKNRFSVLVRASKDCKNFNAKNVLNNILTQFAGKGGGREDLAQGSCELPNDLNNFQNISRTELTKELSK